MRHEIFLNGDHLVRLWYAGYLAQLLEADHLVQLFHAGHLVQLLYAGYLARLLYTGHLARLFYDASKSLNARQRYNALKTLKFVGCGWRYLALD